MNINHNNNSGSLIINIIVVTPATTSNMTSISSSTTTMTNVRDEHPLQLYATNYHLVSYELIFYSDHHHH